MGVRHRASVGNGFELASNELRDATHHIVNPPLARQVPGSNEPAATQRMNGSWPYHQVALKVGN